ncbi:peptidoglycan DD-metalloendopeptidase family protein [Patescibacteria group bacterium]
MPVRQRIHNSLSRMRKSWLYPLTTKYVVHFIIIILTILVTTHSLGAREIRTEDFGQGSLLASIVGIESDEIVETVETINNQTSYADTRGVLRINPEPASEEDVASLLATATGGTSLVKTSTPTTTIDFDRENVEEYIVQGGDTVSSIASTYSISSATILWANDMSETDYIRPGQKLKIPPTSGVVHTVKSGDTISKIASKYSADEVKILEYNKLADASAIEVDQVLIVPGGRIEPPPVPVTTGTVAGSVYGGSPPPSVQASPGSRLNWPTTSRRIYQYFTWRHTGIDIDGNYGNPIYAAQAGRVVKADGGWNGGYGLMIIIDHGNGLQTLYGHVSKFYVNVGDSVGKGQSIAAVGSTGRSTGPHLHFEVRVGGRRVNPLSYL